MDKIKSFTSLTAWNEGHELVLLIYKVTDQFPTKEIYGLTDQIRRASVSVTSNIAEGFSKQTMKEKRQCYYISLGSLTELQNQLLIAKDIGYLSIEDFKILANKSVVVSKLVNGIIKSAFSK